MPQHLTCVRALTEISDAKVRGDSIGSTELLFEPSAVKPGDYHFDIGTAGSTSLLLQAILPALVFAEGNSSVTLKGGTHVPFSPPYEYINEIFLSALGRLGINILASIKSYGFYPKGGGEITVRLSPPFAVRGTDFGAREEGAMISGVSAVANLPLAIAERQRTAALRLLSGKGVRARIDLLEAPSPGRGTFVFLRAGEGGCRAGFSALGAIGKKAEAVGEEAAAELAAHLSTPACLDPHLSDQILLYLALAEGESSFTVSRITEHLLTNGAVVNAFLGPVCFIKGEKGEAGAVWVSGKTLNKRGYKPARP
jgi:RNA 3'-terminal phosphate cyclase (ATP)